MYDLDPHKGDPSTIPEKPALPIYDAIHERIDATASEMRQEASIVAELNRVEASVKQPKIGQDKDGAISRLTPTDDKAVAINRPELGANTHVFFANGIETSFERARIEGTMLAARVGQPVDLVYVRTDGLQSDLSKAVGETFDPAAGKRNPPERALAAGIVAALDRGEDVHVVGFSRGALVTQLALDSVADHYREQGHPTSWIERHVAPRITVETFNGASHAMPPGVRAKHYVRDTDVLVAQSIGMGEYAPLVRATLASAVDATLASINDVPPEKRQAMTHAANDLVATALGVQGNVEAITLSSPIDRLGQIRTDVRTIVQGLASEHHPAPGADEIRRDGYANTPNGPIIHVGGLIDHDEPNPLLKLADQHDLPQMLAAREPFEAHPAPQARTHERDRGVAHAPMGDSLDHHVPSFRRGEVQHLGPGFRESGRIVDVDENRIVLSVIEHGHDGCVTLDRHTLEPMFASHAEFAGAIKPGKSVELSIDHAGKAHAQVLAPEHTQLRASERVRARTVSRDEGQRHER